MPLALKYRPRTLSDLAGQPQICLVVGEMLRRWAADEIEMPSGLLLTGPRGCGKTSAARIIAAALNCESEKPVRPCTQCSSCDAIYNFTSDSVLEIDGATSGLVDDVRALARAARLTHSGKYRVFIIDEVHAASKEAFSALLKQLEEPPPNVVYILVTTDYQLVPATIRSRCLQFQFSSLSVSDVANRLYTIAQKEHLAPDKDAFHYIARRSGGSMRDALMMLEQLQIINDVSLQKAHEIWPDELATFAKEFLRTASQQDTEAGMTTIHKAFIIYHDNQQMADAVVQLLKEQAIAYQKDKKSSLAPRVILNLMGRVWELRISLKGAQSTDPIPIEALWFMFSKELAGTSASSPSAKLKAEVLDEVASKEKSNLDAMFEGKK